MARSEWAITQDMMNGKFTTDAKYGVWSEPYPGPDQTRVRFYREMKNGKVIGIKEIKTATGGLQKLEIPLEEVNWHLSKDAEGSEVKDASFATYYVDPSEWCAIQVLAITAKTVKFWFCNDETQIEYVETVSHAEFEDFLRRFGFRPTTSSTVANFKYRGWKQRVKELGRR